MGLGKTEKKTNGVGQKRKKQSKTQRREEEKREGGRAQEGVPNQADGRKKNKDRGVRRLHNRGRRRGTSEKKAGKRKRGRN